MTDATPHRYPYWGWRMRGPRWLPSPLHRKRITMPTVNITLPRSFADEAARAIGNAAYDASRRAESLGGDGQGATLAREAMLLRLLHSDILRSLAGCPLFDLDGNPLAPDADCCPVTGQEYGTGA